MYFFIGAQNDADITRQKFFSKSFELQNIARQFTLLILVHVYACIIMLLIDLLFHYWKFIADSASERIFKINHHLVK